MRLTQPWAALAVLFGAISVLLFRLHLPDEWAESLAVRCIERGEEVG